MTKDPRDKQGVWNPTPTASAKVVATGDAISRPGDETLSDMRARRVWITQVEPSVDGGRFPAKAIVGEPVTVTAQIFVDGHDHLAAVVRHRAASAEEWQEIPMLHGPGDAFEGRFLIAKLERHQFTIEAWVDPFDTWRDALGIKFGAGQDVQSELLEGAAMVRAAGERASAKATAGPTEGDPEADARRLFDVADQLEGDGETVKRVQIGLAQPLAVLMFRHAGRDRSTALDSPLEIDVARPRARAGLWYEMFPRSAGAPDRHGTFADAERELPRIKELGFDVLYLPPIHPIGFTYRKGRNNTLVVGADDPGSPWAIGSPEGGHTAVHPELGTLDDFLEFRRACEEHGLELALDIAFQCSPDHPWVKEHPQWFRHRPDGTIKYAENPPKRYQDIYPLNFDTEDWRNLWRALRDVFLFWAERGVRIFRVDNPHTKPIGFWEWCIEAVKQAFPDAIFLSEAFTRPNVKYALAKAGFDQSYTYFTWRNTRWEIETYLTELTRSEVRHFFRPNFFANTPDILPEFLQMDGRPAFMLRYVLATTLSASSGIYSGYELCENTPLSDREEYLDSEKYQITYRDFSQPGNINEFIRRVNAAWQENPALHRNDTLRFHPTDNEQILFYSKTTPDLSNIVLVVVNLDPYHMHHGWVEVPLDELGLSEVESYQMHDLLGGGRYLWRGRRNYVRLDPEESPTQLFRVRRRVRTERDFDYYL